MNARSLAPRGWSRARSGGHHQVVVVQGLIIGELDLTRCDIHSDRAAAEEKLDARRRRQRLC
ncbi:hypothetical protein [Mycolicibacterium sp. D3]